MNKRDKMTIARLLGETYHNMEEDDDWAAARGIEIAAERFVEFFATSDADFDSEAFYDLVFDR